jgi:hypothetical protein
MFDPYHKWLGIPPKDQPPNYYRLLAIDAFESDTEVIDAAANRQMAYVQQRATGEHIAESQKLLSELSVARLCLLDKKKKAVYDLQLKVNLAQQARRTGGPQEKPPRKPPLADLKSAAPLAGRTKAPPVVGALPPPVEDMSGEDAPYFQGFQWIRVLYFVLGGGLFLVMALVILLIIVPGGEKETNSKIDQAASEIEAGGANGNRTERQIRSVGAAIYEVEIDPPSATLVIQNNMGTITGTGKTRQIRFENVASRSYVNVTASCDGYKPLSKLMAPRAGQNDKLTIVLQKESTAQLNNSRDIPPQPTTKDTSNAPPAGTNNPPTNPTIKINRPIDGRPESAPIAVEAPKTERHKVFVFGGESAIVTPVARSLPSTVEAWIWCQAPDENANMYVFGSDDAKLPTTCGLGVCIGKDGQLGGRRTQKNKKLWDFWTGEFLPIQKWTHLAVTFDDDKICFFVDGRLLHTDKGAQKAGTANFVVGYIGIVYNIRQYNPIYSFVGKIRTVRISTGVRYIGEFRPPFDFNKNQDKEGIKTSLIYNASDVKGDVITDLSGNNKDGAGIKIKTVEEEFPIQ